MKGRNIKQLNQKFWFSCYVTDMYLIIGPSGTVSGRLILVLFLPAGFHLLCFLIQFVG